MSPEAKAAALNFLGLASLSLSVEDTDEAKTLKAEIDTTRDLVENYESLNAVAKAEKENRAKEEKEKFDAEVRLHAAQSEEEYLNGTSEKKNQS